MQNQWYQANDCKKPISCDTGLILFEIVILTIVKEFVYRTFSRKIRNKLRPVLIQ
uniref:Uncharacterized protein n=1 Tax=Anguilla anguilla TaxID=7936 RepID=A0A0E9U4D2_ANGAN